MKLTNVQKEIVQTLINISQSKKGNAVKGEEIAQAMHRNPGTIRNQMQALRSKELVKGVSGPHGGYKPTIEAYKLFNIALNSKQFSIPLFKEDEFIEDAKFKSLTLSNMTQNKEILASINIIGNIKIFESGDSIRLGPSETNQLTISGTVVSREDTENMLLVALSSVFSFPRLLVSDLCTYNIISISPDDSFLDAVKLITYHEIKSVAVMEGKVLVGVITFKEVKKYITKDMKNIRVGDVMSKDFFCVDEFSNSLDAFNILQEEEVDSLIVVDDDDDPIGIIAKGDFSKTMMYNQLS